MPDDFLTSVVSAASTVSAYAGSVTNENEETDNGLTDYYNTLIGTMM